MPQIDPKELANAVIDQMKNDHHIFWVDPEVHSVQHDFIKMLIEERVKKIERQERIKEKIMGSVILSGLMLFIGLVGAGALDWIRNHLK